MKTEFHVEVVRIGEIQKHPNADTLSITNINGYPVVIKTGAFQTGDLAVYVPVDAMVPTSRPEFDFLAKPGVEHHRIRAVRLRGVFSMGLLVPASEGMSEGQDVAEALGVTKFLSLTERRELLGVPLGSGKKATYRDPGFMPIYGLDAVRKFGHVLEEGEMVAVTEKIHGTNFRACWKDGRLWVGSHRVMRGHTYRPIEVFLTRLKLKVLSWFGKAGRTSLLRDTGDVWWECVHQYNLEEKLQQIPDHVLYGEIYGEGVQDLTYDSPQGRKFVAFDIYSVKESRFLSYNEFRGMCAWLEIPTAPVLAIEAYSPELLKLAEGKSTLASHIREGIVIKPLVERFHPNVGRVALKLAGEGYLLRKDEQEVVPQPGLIAGVA